MIDFNDPNLLHKCLVAMDNAVDVLLEISPGPLFKCYLLLIYKAVVVLICHGSRVNMLLYVASMLSVYMRPEHATNVQSDVKTNS